jgi:hypothetical protein
MIHNGDHAEFEREHANTKPEDRPDWPLPSFDAVDWAKAFCKIATNLGYRDAEGQPVDEGWMVGWFANALMRGYDEYAKRQARATPTPTEAREKIARIVYPDGFCREPNPDESKLMREARRQAAFAKADAILALLPDAAAIRAAHFEEAAKIADGIMYPDLEASSDLEKQAYDIRCSIAAAIRNAGRTG